MAKADSTIQVRIDAKTKKQAKKTLNDIGIDMSSAIKLFLRNVVITQSIPFSLRTENGFTVEYEQMLLREAENATKYSRGYKTAKELHNDILSRNASS